MFSMIDSLMRYEQDGLSDMETLELFSYLIKKGYAWTLNGSYGRMAERIINDGLIDKDGNIHKDAEYKMDEMLNG